MSQYDQHQVKKKQSAVIHRTLLVTCRCNSVTTSAANITQYYNAKTYSQEQTCTYQIKNSKCVSGKFCNLDK